MKTNKYYIIQDEKGNLQTIFGKLLAVADPTQQQAPNTYKTLQAKKPRKAKARGYKRQTIGKTYQDQKGQTFWQDITKKALQIKGYNQTQLGNFLGVHNTTVSCWKLGKATPNPQHLQKLLAIVQGGAN